MFHVGTFLSVVSRRPVVRPSSREVIERKSIELSGMRWIWNRISSERPFHSIVEIKGTAIDGHFGYVRHWQEVGQAMFYLFHIITYVNGKHLLGSHLSGIVPRLLSGLPVLPSYASISGICPKRSPTPAQGWALQSPVSKK